MKNLDMGSPIRCLCAERLRIDVHTRAYLLRSFRDDPVSGIKTVRDHPAAVYLRPDCNWSNCYLVVVIDYGNLVAAL